MELFEFDFYYEIRTVIKFQYLVDFIAEYTEISGILFLWNLYVDGFSNKTGSGVGVIFESD
ncbi:hypothetical protein DF186_14645 [Enterococcus hirae]|nr:hypothetical protein DF186_14645 [Enterococcus hirae]